MALPGFVKLQIAHTSGLSLGTVDGIFRDLRSNEMIPMGKAGRNKDQGHFEPYHLANLILACAGPSSSNAAEAVRRLRNLNDNGNNLSNDIEWQIKRASSLLNGDPGVNYEDIWESLSLCFDLPAATAEWLDPNDQMRPVKHFFYLPNYSDQPAHKAALVRNAIVHRDLLLMAGWLWLDTLKHRNETSAPLPGNRRVDCRTA